MEGGGARTQTVKGNGRSTIKVDNGGAGFSLEVIFAMEPKFIVVPGQGWNTTAS